MTLAADVPLVVRFDRPAFALPADGRITGRLNADLALARLVGLAGLDDQTLSGDLKLDLGVNGTLGAPGEVPARSRTDASVKGRRFSTRSVVLVAVRLAGATATKVRTSSDSRVWTRLSESSTASDEWSRNAVLPSGRQWSSLEQ